jgi:SNF2 family DNA or RNA helicase
MLTVKFRIPPYDHQRNILRETFGQKFFGYFMEPGTGKTKLSIDLAGELWLRDEIQCVVVIAPNGVHEQWIEEQIPEHAPLNLEYESLLYRSGGGQTFKREANATIARARKHGRLLFVAINIEAVNAERGFNFVEWLLEELRCLLIIDESTKIRNHRAERTKALLELAPKAAYRRILSGTPLVKGFENLWSQFEFLSPSIINCKTFTGFKALYCKTQPVIVNRMFRGKVVGKRIVGKRITGYRNVSNLMQKIEPHVRILRKVDCLDLPDKIPSKVHVPFTDEQTQAYESMKEELFVRLERELPELDLLAKVNAVSAARTKLRQIAIGFLIDENRVAHPIKTNRFDMMLDQLENAPGKSIVWSSFIYSLERIEEEFKKAGVRYVRFARGNTQAVRDFNDPNGPDVFLGNPHSGGIGLNLAVADTMIFVNDVDDAEVRWQAEDRAHRIGQTKHLNIIDMFTRGTVEIKIRSQRVKKESLAAMVMEGRWRDAL